LKIVEAINVKPNITTIMQKKLLQKSHCKQVIKQTKLQC